MREDRIKAYQGALKMMEYVGPSSIHAKAAGAAGVSDGFDDEALCEHLRGAGVNDPLRMALRLALATFDHAPADSHPWAQGTVPDSAERRSRLISALEVGAPTAVLFAELFPVLMSGTTVIAGKWDPWYIEERRVDRFYWNSYSSHLLRRGWDADVVAELDRATDLVVERLSEPTRTDAYQSKGLVVGYVQSGKTANFTGVAAKAVDAGYRLIIVLTGTTERLRAQTQRRLDMELVGQENILRGIDAGDEEALAGVDYHNDDPDWPMFLRHGVRPGDAGRPDLLRMTTRRFDYRSLEQGINALDFRKARPGLALNHPDNLAGCDARLVVVKKNATVLKRLAKDLGKITMRLAEIPTLIIDDESDQASLNTMSRRKWDEGHRKRTEINRLISDLLHRMPRAQYIGYTATPFANVFVDPADAGDIFPKDFLIALDRPVEYMGARDFHDLNPITEPAERSFADSRELAHVRPIVELDDDMADDDGMLHAIDTFVITGAVKLYRRDQGVGTFRHHTMLVQEAMHKDVHAERAEHIKKLWYAGGYYSGTYLTRLRKLFDTDIAQVSTSISPHVPSPANFDELQPYLAQAIGMIGQTGNPVLVVNSDQIEGEALDFERNDVWRILVGGNQLARGFTVEGLTVSYYRRRTKQADTLMQMGRWFGYRKGYRDLVRLFITPELYEAFEAICRDEEYFRNELKQYAVVINGEPLITPADVPPLVASHLTWVKPTSSNKMYNAELAQRRTPNKEPTAYPSLSDKDLLKHNTHMFGPIFKTLASEPVQQLAQGGRPFRARVCELDHATVLSVLRQLKWSNKESFKADVAWLETLPESQLDRWLVVAPQLKNAEWTALIDGVGPFSLHQRAATGEPRRVGVKSTLVERSALETLVRVPGSTRAGMLLYPTVPKDLSTPPNGGVIEPGEVVIAFRLIMPESTTPADGRLVTFRTRDSSAEA
ncbi:Z1 domain-containing protein [Catellatospora paridis]|uniref:Z1 domain-containing protein n=1 Tax=Catellatospora paridis TaxID=1617086 RepID=UPI001E2D3C49|nr:Z1 domain-containing protein [Catellatospora paridis]